MPARELWALVDRAAEGWLATCEPPFWGRPGKRRPPVAAARDPLRRADREVPGTAGIHPKSVFQIGGAGAVGTGSLRGMPVLHRLHTAQFSIWPFDPHGWPRVVEIYPRLLTGQVKKSNAADRAAYLERYYPTLGDELRGRAASSEDAFDAAVSALVMAQHLDDLNALPSTTDRQLLLEGLIWHPSWQGTRSQVPAEPADDSFEPLEAV